MRARSTGMSSGGGAAPLSRIDEGRHAVALIVLHVEKEHVRRVLGQLQREVAQQVGLQTADAEDEERAEPDREQDDTRLVAGPRHVQHGVPQRERARVTQRLHRAHERHADEVQHEGERDEAARQHQPDAQ